MLTETIVMSVLLLGLLVVSGFWLASFIHKSDVKGQRRLRNLKKQVKDDPGAAQELERLKRKKRNKRKKNAKSIAGDVCLSVMLLGLALALTLLFVLPGWTDFILKDYQIYEGEFEVTRGSSKPYYIDLDDGASLRGGGGLDLGEHNGRVVYSKRTHTTMGVEAE